MLVGKILTVYRELYNSRDLILNLVSREVKGKYKRTLLGQLWSFANPISYMVIYTFVFSFVFRVATPIGSPSGVSNYALWILCGLVPWLFFSKVLTVSADSLLTNADLLTKVYFYRASLPISLVLAQGYTLLFELGILSLALLIAGSSVIIWLPLILLQVLLLILFSSGLGLILSIWNVHFRDTQHLLTLLLQLWFFATPIVYPISMVQAQSEEIGTIIGNKTLLDIYQLNPMTAFVEGFRATMYDNSLPSIENWISCGIWAVISIILGVFIFSKADKNIVEAL